MQRDVGMVVPKTTQTIYTGQHKAQGNTQVTPSLHPFLFSLPAQSCFQYSHSKACSIQKNRWRDGVTCVFPLCLVYLVCVVLAHPSLHASTFLEDTCLCACWLYHSTLQKDVVFCNTFSMHVRMIVCLCHCMYVTALLIQLASKGDLHVCLALLHVTIPALPEYCHKCTMLLRSPSRIGKVQTFWYLKVLHTQE